MNNRVIKIYIPYWISDKLHESDNPYIYTLVERMKFLHSDVEFFFNKEIIWEDTCESMDIIHIMWPNIFADAMEKGKDLHQRLQYLKQKNIKIISTCHNIKPHTKNITWEKAYNIVYNSCDIMIHLGAYSLNYCRNIYSQSNHYIIPHHIYDTLYNYFPTHEEALSKLKLSNKYKYILCFGAFRNEDERAIIKEIAKRFRGKKVKIIAPTFYDAPGGKYKIWRKSSRKLLIAYIKYHNIIISGHRISNLELPLYYSACDVALLQRLEILNSGNLPLAFLFGKVVVGPKIGNVNEYLESTGNPAFDPNDINSIYCSINRGIQLSKSDLGKKNKKIAFDYWKTDIIAEKIYSLYMQCIYQL